MESIQEHRSILQESLRLCLLEDSTFDPAEPHPFRVAVADLPPVPVIPPVDNDQEQ